MKANKNRRSALTRLSTVAASLAIGAVLLPAIAAAQGKEIIFALVAGSFLHISTTIFFETSPNHKIDLRYWLIMSLGCLLAIYLEFV